MAAQLVKFIFEQAQYSFTEQFYSQEDSTSKGLQLAKNLGTWRGTLLGTNAKMDCITVSDTEVTGDSDVLENPGHRRRFSAQVAEVPWLGLRLLLLARIGFNPNTPVYHRTYFVRGIPHDAAAISGNAVDGYKLSPGYERELDSFIAILTSGLWHLKVAAKGLASNPITAPFAVPGHLGLCDFTAFPVIPLVGDTVTFKGFEGPWKDANGVHRVIAHNGGKFRVAVPFRADPMNGHPSWTPRQSVYAKIYAAKYQGVFKHNTGVTRRAAKGQKKRRPSPIPE